MLYLVPIATLLLVIAGFFLLARGSYRCLGRYGWILRLVAALPLAMSGVAHFLRTSMFAEIIPPFFPAPRMLVFLSGCCELAGAIGLFLPFARRTAALLLAFLMVAVFPANIYIAGHVVDGVRMPGVAWRTTIQLVYIVLLLLAGWGVPLPGSGKGRSNQATFQ